MLKKIKMVLDFNMTNCLLSQNKKCNPFGLEENWKFPFISESFVPGIFSDETGLNQP